MPATGARPHRVPGEIANDAAGFKGCGGVEPEPPAPLEWRVSDAPVAYPEALAAMEARVAAIRAGTAPASSSGCSSIRRSIPPAPARAPPDLLAPARFPVFSAGRGGQYTYHGPGQRVAYVMLDLQRRGPDLRAYVWRLEEWVIRTLAQFGVRGERRAGRVGIWVARPDGERGQDRGDRRARPPLGELSRRRAQPRPRPRALPGIVPCGIREFGVTSLADLGLATSMAELDEAHAAATFTQVFDGSRLRRRQLTEPGRSPARSTGTSTTSVDAGGRRAAAAALDHRRAPPVSGPEIRASTAAVARGCGPSPRGRAPAPARPPSRGTRRPGPARGCAA